MYVHTYGCTVVQRRLYVLALWCRDKKSIYCNNYINILIYWISHCDCQYCNTVWWEIFTDQSFRRLAIVKDLENIFHSLTITKPHPYHRAMLF